MAAWPPGERGRPPGPKWLQEEKDRFKTRKRRQGGGKTNRGNSKQQQYDQQYEGDGYSDDMSDGQEWSYEMYEGRLQDGQACGPQSTKVGLRPLVIHQ